MSVCERLLESYDSVCGRQRHRPGKAILSVDYGCVALYQGLFFPSLWEGDAEVTLRTQKNVGRGV